MWRSMTGDPPPYYARMNKQSMNVNPVTNSLKRAYESSTSTLPPLSAHRSGILPQRSRQIFPELMSSEIGQRVDELLSRFFINAGISYDNVDDPSLVQLMNMICPQVNLPTPATMEQCIGRLAYPMKVKSVINFGKAVGPLTATLHTYKFNDEIFLAYSIHFFDDYIQRRNVVYMRKLILCEIDGESVITYVRRSINNFNYGNVRFTNMVTVDEGMADELIHTNAVTNNYICFFTYLSRFIENVLKIEDFRMGLTSLRNFIIFLRSHADLYSKFRRMQLSKNGELDLPCIDDGKWTSTTVFLTRCLLLHETFADFAMRFRLTTYISDDTYSKLSYLQRLMSHCRRFARELSTPDSSVSQIVPTVTSIKGFLDGKSVGFGFEDDVRAVFRKHLQPLINGQENARYQFACLLDPRYGYRGNIYTMEKWLQIESDLLALFSQEDMVLNDKCPGETVILKPHSRTIRQNKIKDEIKLYRAALTASRPNATTNVFQWWGSRMMELVNLYNKSRELLAPPAVAIDTEYYFGRSGKWTHMCSNLNYEQLENALSVAGQQEQFKGRGYISESALAPIVNDPKRRPATNALPRPNHLKTHIDTRDPRNVPSTSAASTLPSVDDMMMMQPPPSKKPRIMPDAEIKKEPGITGDTVVKIEPDDPPPQLEVKQEIIDEGYEDVKPPVLEATSSSTTQPAPSILTETIQEDESKCCICLRAEEPEKLKECILPNEKLIVLLGMVVDSKMSIEEARYCYLNIKRTLICHRHFKESCDQLFSSLELAIPDDVFTLPHTRIKYLLDYIEDIRAKDMPLLAFKQLFIIFCEKYPPTQLKAPGTITFDAIFSRNHRPEESASSSQKTSLLPKGLRAQRKPNDRDMDSPIYHKAQEMLSQERKSLNNQDKGILPKSQRAPRKQKLEGDSAESEDMIIRRVIPIEISYELPSKIKNPGKCSYCNNTVERADLIRVPKSETRRKLWFDKLGEKFERKVKAFENSFICRAHFAKHHFSKTGRLVKNAMPYAIGELVSYEIVEDHLLQSDDETESDDEAERFVAPNQMLMNIVKEEELVDEKPNIVTLNAEEKPPVIDVKPAVTVKKPAEAKKPEAVKKTAVVQKPVEEVKKPAEAKKPEAVKKTSVVQKPAEEVKKPDGKRVTRSSGKPVA